MKLRHQNDSDENSHSSSTNELGESNKLVNGVKKSINSIKNSPSSKTVGTIKVSSISEIPTLNKKSSDVSREVQPESPADSVRSKPLQQKLTTPFLLKNNSPEKSKADKNCKESVKSLKINVEFEETDDEEEDNVALKTLMENLDKGLATNEDAKKSQAMIDDLMSVLEKDSKTEVLDCEKKDESSLAENQEESKNKAKKREAEQTGNSKLKCVKLETEANIVETSKGTSESDVVVINNDPKPSEKSKSESSENLETVKCSESDEIVADAIDKDSANDESKEKNENENKSTENVVKVTKVEVVESNYVPNGIEDDDVMEIVVGGDVVNNKREADSPAVSDLPLKRSKRLSSEESDGKSRLESYLTRPIAELKTGESGNETQNSEKKKNPPKEKIYKLTKAELETLIINKVTDYFSDADKCEIGAIRKRCEHLEKMLETWRKKAVFYQRKVTDFQISVQRIQIRRQPNAKPPMRSVGLQVQLIKDPNKYSNPAVPTGGKHSIMLPNTSVKNVLPKLTPNNQMAFITNLGTHVGALGTTTIVTNSPKLNSQNANVIKTSPIIPNGSANVSILQAKLSSPNSAINVSSAAPIPLRLIQNQAMRNGIPTSSTATATSITVSLVNQQPQMTNAGVKLIDLTGEEQEEAAKAAAAAAAAGANGSKRIIPKCVAATQLPVGITMVPTLANSNTLTVINASNASVNGGQVLTLSAGANIGVSTVANLNTVGVTTPAIRGPTTTPIIGSAPVRLAHLAYLMPAGMMVRQPSGQQVLMPATHVRPNQQLMKSGVQTLVLRNSNTILPIQNGQIQQNQIRPVLPVNPSPKVVASTASVSTSTPATAVIKPNIKPAGSSTSILLSPSPAITKAAVVTPLKHPAPLPPNRVYHAEVGNKKQPPPKPALKISKVDTGIVLSWNMVLTPNHAQINSYQLYAYQENDSPPQTSLWKKVGDVRALPLPMACTLTQFNEGHKYYFAVRSVDAHNRMGPFSDPGSITLVKATSKKS